MDRVEADDMTIVAWVGPDEFDGTRGIKGAFTRAGFVPLAAKGEHEEKLRRPEVCEAMRILSARYGTRIQLVRFAYVEVIETIEPER